MIKKKKKRMPWNENAIRDMTPVKGRTGKRK
jgi:hypothetical protein